MRKNNLDRPAHHRPRGKKTSSAPGRPAAPPLSPVETFFAKNQAVRKFGTGLGSLIADTSGHTGAATSNRYAGVIEHKEGELIVVKWNHAKEGGPPDTSVRGIYIPIKNQLPARISCQVAELHRSWD